MATGLVLDNVSMRFGGVRAVDGVSFAMDENDVVGLIGPNGAGKTTLLNCISGLLQPTGGRITWQNHHSPWSLEDAVRLGIVKTFQQNRVFWKETVEENLRIGQHLLRMSGLRGGAKNAEAKSEHIMADLDLLQHRGTVAANLPLGVARRLAVGLALATEPNLLLLDEPAAGLSLGEMDELIGLLARLRGRATIMLIDHNMGFIMRVCPRILVLDQGLLIADGPPEAVQQDPRVIQAYLGKSGGTASGDAATVH